MDERLREHDRRLRQLARSPGGVGPEDAGQALLADLRAGRLSLKKLRRMAKEGDAAARAAHRIGFWAARTFTYYRPQLKGVEGDPLTGLVGCSRTALPGDRIIPIRVQKKRLRLLGSFVVLKRGLARSLFPEELLDTLKPYQRGQDSVSGQAEFPYRERLASAELLAGWRFQTQKGDEDPLRYVEGELILRHAPLDGLRLLTASTTKQVVDFMSSWDNNS